MFKIVKIINRFDQNGTNELIELLNGGWKIHDKTATHDWIIYILWIHPTQASGSYN